MDRRQILFEGYLLDTVYECSRERVVSVSLSLSSIHLTLSEEGEEGGYSSSRWSGKKENVVIISVGAGWGHGYERKCAQDTRVRYHITFT